MTSYETIYNCFLRKIDDPELANQLDTNPEWIEEDFKGYLHSAVSKQLKVIETETITFNDEEEYIEEDLSDFEVEILALGMVVEWLTPIVRRTANLRQMFGGKEEKWFSQSSHLSELTSMLEESKLEIRKLVRDHGYEHNSYIDG